jgi:hypothetical protein
MSLNHIVEGGLADITLDVKGITIQGEPVGLKSLSLDQATYPNLDLTNVGTVYLDAGPSTVISGVTGTLSDGQSVKFMTCKQASSITIQSFGTIQTSTGSDIVLSGIGECAQAVWSDALGYLTVVKTS